MSEALTRPESLIAAALRGEPVAWPAPGDDCEIVRFLDCARYHGVIPLLTEHMSKLIGDGSPAAEILSACRDEAVRDAMQELARRIEISRVLDRLADAGIKALVLKGGALAYSHYPSPNLRPRSDTDLLIPQSMRPQVEQILARLGFERVSESTGELVSYQAAWRRKDNLGVNHLLDVHWRINNSQILAKVLSYEDLAARATRLPVLGPSAYALCPVDALLFACIHRAGHASAPYFIGDTEHTGGDRLIWLYDAHLLIKAMAAAELDEFAALAKEKQIRAICLDMLVRVREYFATSIAAEALQALMPSGPVEASARYLTGGRMRQVLGDLQALENWGDRARWVKESLFPPDKYMRHKYPDAPNALLFILYMRRAYGWLRSLKISHR